jgi:hypothetical protein
MTTKSMSLRYVYTAGTEGINSTILAIKLNKEVLDQSDFKKKILRFNQFSNDILSIL